MEYSSVLTQVRSGAPYSSEHDIEEQISPYVENGCYTHVSIPISETVYDSAYQHIYHQVRAEIEHSLERTAWIPEFL